MNNAAQFDLLDHAIDQMLAGLEAPPVEGNDEMTELLAVAQDLALLPAEGFKERLALELQSRTIAAQPDGRALRSAAAILPTLFSGGIAPPPASRMNVAASLLVHAVALSLIVSSTYFVAEKQGMVPPNVVDLVTREIYPVPVAREESSGGGSGGSRSKLDASHGALPRASDQQFTPPTVEKFENAKLEVAPTIIIPTNIQPQKMAEIGDPTSNVMIPSNGTGANGGIGTEVGGGVGLGRGVGYGPGTGPGVLRVGKGIKPPRQIYSPDPDYSEEARKMKHQGSVMLWMVVGTDGRPRNIRVQRSLGLGLDEKAVEAVKTWRFEPARKDGQPVAVQINVEVLFRLY
jgi:periplasmic protein TonB